MPAPTRAPSIKLDETAAAPASVGGQDLTEFIDENSLQAETRRAYERNRVGTRPFRQYQKKVIERAEVPNTHQTRQMASHVCGSAARLPFVPDSEVTIQDASGKDTNEFEQQIIQMARFAEEMLGSEMVWTVSARKLARAALEIRRSDPDGSKGIAWVNDTLEDEAHVLDD